MSEVVSRCTARAKQSGQQCRKSGIKGSEPPRCRNHIGSTKAMERAAMRAELQAWRVTDELLDDTTVMLRLMSQSFRRAAYYGWLIEQVHEDAGGDLADLLGSLIGTVKRAAGKDGVIFDSEEAVRGLIVLEGQERDRAFGFAERCRRAGIADRVLRIEEAKAAAVVSLIRRVLVGAGLDPSEPRISALVHRELLQLESEGAQA